MAFIGAKPTNVPLTSADLEDSIITSAKIVDGTIATADISDGAVTSVKTTGDGGANTPAFLIYKSASDGSQDLTDGSYVQIVMTGEKFDTDNACASSTFTVPSGKDGKYFFTTHATFQNSHAADQITFFAIYKNGSQVSYKQNYFVNAGVHTFEHSVILDLSAADTIKFYIKDDTATNVKEDDGALYTYMMGFKLIT